MAKKSFEEALAQLQTIVEEMEKGDIPLEKALRKFEDGMKLSRYCSECLDEAEEKLTLLTASGEEKDFSPENPDSE